MRSIAGCIPAAPSLADAKDKYPFIAALITTQEDEAWWEVIFTIAAVYIAAVRLRNLELGEARENALARASAQATRLGAGGLIGMAIDHHIEVREVERNDVTREDLIVTFHVLGTAIVELGEHRPLGVRTVMNLGGA